MTLDVAPEVAAALEDPAVRERVARLVSRAVRPASVERLFAAMDALSAEARRRGLTDEILEEELAVHNAERREQPAHSAEDRSAAGRELAAEFRAFCRGRTLGGLEPKSLIREGLR